MEDLAYNLTKYVELKKTGLQRCLYILFPRRLMELMLLPNQTLCKSKPFLNGMRKDDLR